MWRLALLLCVILAGVAFAGPRGRLVTEYRHRKKALVGKDAGALVHLAEWCRASKLFEEEKEALRLALDAQPGHEVAKKKLEALLAEEARHRDMKTPWRRDARVLFVETNTSEAKLHDFCDTVSAFYARFGKLFKVPKSPLEAWGKPIGVKIFRTRADFDRYQKDQGEEPGESTVGYYDLETKELVLYDDPEDPRETIGTLYHEGTHLFMHLVLGDRYDRVPHWLHEGLAEVFTPSMARLAEAREALRAKPPALAALLETGHDDFESEHYALSWALVHMLVEKKKDGRHVHRDAFVRYLDAVAGGARPLETFTKTIGPLERIEKEWHAWIDEMPLPPWERALALIDEDRWVEAIPFLRKHLDKEKEDAEARATLGWALYALAVEHVEAGKKAEARAALGEARKLLGEQEELRELEKDVEK